MEAGFSVDIDRRDGVFLLRLRGELDMMSAPTLHDCLGAVLEVSRKPAVVIDVAELAFCDSSGLAALLGAQRVTEATGGCMALSAVTGRLSRLLQLTGLEERFYVFSTTREAVAFVK
ncbi:STAS domain-containing protein [Nonomuraea sp. NPDC050310]|uniref:STAS domain-containing protein n=1 Tax=Nonomuraea sp. NPDC050310 TaxID=3154935 RepID=UPI0033F6C057